MAVVLDLVHTKLVRAHSSSSVMTLVKPVLAPVYMNHQEFASLSSWIEVANMVTEASMPAHRIEILGFWNSEAYQCVHKSLVTVFLPITQSMS